MLGNSEIDSKTVLITGADGDIGKGLAQKFSSQGWTPILSGIEKEDHDEKWEYIKLDVTLEDDWINAFKEIEKKYSSLNCLVNNAGVTGTLVQDNLDVENTNLSTWKQIHDINLNGAFLGCKHALKHMKKYKNRTIINIGSRSGIISRSKRVAYSTSKAALHHLTKAVASHCGEKGYHIRCNAIAGATIRTKIWDPVIAKSQLPAEMFFKKVSENIPLGRFGTTDEIADAVYFLASGNSSYINGTILVVDGGILASNGTET